MILEDVYLDGHPQHECLELFFRVTNISQVIQSPGVASCSINFNDSLCWDPSEGPLARLGRGKRRPEGIAHSSIS